MRRLRVGAFADEYIRAASPAFSCMCDFQASFTMMRYVRRVPKIMRAFRRACTACQS